MGSRDTARAGSVLPEVFGRLEFRERLREHEVWNIWPDVVGEILSTRAEPMRIEDGRLFVRVADSAWMQELQFLKDEIRARLNDRLGRRGVRQIYLVLGDVTPARQPPDPLPSHPVDEIAIASLIPDTDHPEIDAALRRVAVARARRLGPTAS